MNEDKEFIDGFLSLMDTLDGDGNGISNSIEDCELSTRELLRSELTMFVMHLSYSDGRVSRNEKFFINEMLGYDYTYDEIKDIVKENKIDSENFLLSIPLCVQLMVDIDNKTYREKEDANLSFLLYKLFALVGGRIISCDENVTNEEMADVTQYLTNIKNYINENIIYEDRKIDSNPQEDVKAFLIEGTGFKFNTSIVTKIIHDNEVKRVEEERERQKKYAAALAPWDAHYFDSPCPFCGAKKVRYSKWEDKRMSTAFWGFYSYELHCRFKCDNCKQMWN